MIKLNIKYSIINELERVTHTINRIDSFVERGYKVDKLLFPKNISYREIKLMTGDKIKKIIVEEYNIDDYNKNIKYIQDRWLQIEPKLSIGIEKMKIIPILEFDIIFTKYGITGSYQSPNIIFINIQKFYFEGLVKTILHELVHLIINTDILNYDIEHWTKERIVDLIVLDLFPELSRIQIISNMEYCDDIFHKYYPNIEKVIFEISKLNNNKNI